MQITSYTLFLATLAATQTAAQCPAVWTKVATNLAGQFRGTDGSCTDAARQAIRLSFHDCFPSSCDGSMILANECEDRVENTQMQPICATFRDTTSQFDVGTADLIQFGTALGLLACQDGLTIPFSAGRVDNKTASPTGQMPTGTDDAASTTAAFKARGFTAKELIALLGAHSVGKDKNGAALDSTVGDLDTTFYTETADNSAPASLDSDRFLSNSTDTKATWASMETRSTWQAAFVPAMTKLATLGVDAASLTDCSDVVANAFA
ncbi:heme peroxidase [Xylariomycetidae sp. FL0641]|nr:heme peroxidase [Xylariomycetidae sp. FL0641]